jgi:uncharacterized protein (DUF433 family)
MSSNNSLRQAEPKAEDVSERSEQKRQIIRRKSEFKIENGDISPLADIIGATPQKVQEALCWLEKRGYVERRYEDDDNQNIEAIYVSPGVLRRLTEPIQVRLTSYLLGYCLTPYSRIVRPSTNSEPLIVGTNVPVKRIVKLFCQGKDMREIQEELMDLTESDFLEALHYYLDNRKEIDKELTMEA